MKKTVSQLNSKKEVILSIFFLIFLSIVFSWKYFLKGLVPIPADVIVGIYYPWRDHIWGGFVAGVPFKNGLLSDVVSIIYPWRIYGINLMKKGIWPLWIPHALGGSPLLANFQSGLLYPLNFLFWLFSDANAWSLYVISQPALASIFCYLFLRNLKLSNLASLFGAIVFAFSGFMMVWWQYGIVGHAGLWLPLLLLVVDKLSRKISLRWWLVGILAVSLSILAGYPQISLLVFLATGFYFIFRVWDSKGRIKLVLKFILFFIFGLGLSSVLLFPGFELWQHSIRQTDPTTAAFNFGLNPFKNFVLFFAPDFFGNPTTGNFWGWGAYNESVNYIGIVGLVLSLMAVFHSRQKKVVGFFSSLLVLGLILAFGNPLSSFIFGLKLPLMAGASAGRFFYWTSFSLAVLVGFGPIYFERKNGEIK